MTELPTRSRPWTAPDVLRALAADIMGARVPVQVRRDIVAKFYEAADEMDELPRPRHPVAASALDWLTLQRAFNDAELVTRPKAPKLADRLLEALKVANTKSDTAQRRLLELSGLPVDYTRPGDLGARLDSGHASTIDILSLCVLVKRDSPLIHPPERP